MFICRGRKKGVCDDCYHGVEHENAEGCSVAMICGIGTGGHVCKKVDGFSVQDYDQAFLQEHFEELYIDEHIH